MEPTTTTTSTSTSTTTTTRANKRRRFDLNVAVLGAGPESIVPSRFVSAREQQLQAFIDATTFQGGARRTFQLMPRHLRRRAMSHNIRRMPRRLREAAQKEMDKCNTKSTGDADKPKKKTRRHKRRPSYLLRDYVRRQREYQWLETHIWHAKRMKMVSLWGYKLAEYPRAKGVRSTFRASEHHCTIHDASYHGVVELVGPHADISSVLSTMTPPDGPSVSNMMYSEGERTWNSHLYHTGQHPWGLIAPVSFLWKPRPERAEDTRQLWIWVHAAAFDEALTAIRQAVASKNVSVQVNSLKDQLLRFELTGAKAHSVLYSVLQLTANQTEVSSQNNPEKLWGLLGELRTPASLPCGIVIPLTVNDPRFTFPPKKHKIDTNDSDVQKNIESLFSNLKLHTTPSPTFSAPFPSPLWNSDSRVAASKVEPYSSVLKKIEKQITEPSAKKLASEVPVFVVQRTEGLTRGYGAGWDLILPAGWGLPFWVSLIFAGARPIGQRDKHKIYTEQGLPFFPHDFPDTRAYANLAVLEAQQLAIAYAKKPPAKRTNYKKLGIFSPFRPPWESLFGIENKVNISLPKDLFNYGNKPPKDKPTTENTTKTDKTNNTDKNDPKLGETNKTATKSTDDQNNDLAKTTKETKDTEKDKQKEDENPKEKKDEKIPFAVLRGPKATALVETKHDTPRQEKHKQKNMKMVWVPKTRQPIEDASSNPYLVRVHIRMAPKGTPKFNALICEPTEEDCKRWIKEGHSTPTSFPTLPKRTPPPKQPISTTKPQPTDSTTKTPSSTAKTPSTTTTTTIKTKKQLKDTIKQQKEADLNALVNGKGFWDVHQPNTPHRKVIGYVTSGNYSHVRSAGSGIGFCTSLSLPTLFDPKRLSGLVLVRNIDSLYYNTAFVSIKE